MSMDEVHSLVEPPPNKKWRAAHRVVLGIVQIATDLVMDTEGPALISQIPGVAVRMAKIAFDHEEICAATYEDAFEKGHIKAAVQSISLPADYITLWGVSCTSLSFILGTERLASQFPPGAKIVTMYDAIVQAFNALNAKRLAVLTPYIAEVHDRNIQLLQQDGFVVAKSMHLDLDKDVLTSAIDPAYIAECAQKLLDPAVNVDAVFVGCSAFRACEPGFISQLEGRLRVPVVTSTQGFLWYLLRKAGIEDAVQGYGKLFELQATV